MPFNRGGGRHGGGDEVRASPASLASFEVAVARRGAPLAGFELVGVHGQAHAAAGLAPLETRLLEDAVESFLLGLSLDLAAAGNDHRADAVGYMAADALGSDGSWMAAIAAGGLLAMLTNSLIPFAYERGREWAGVATVLGFCLSLAGT